MQPNVLAIQETKGLNARDIAAALNDPILTEKLPPGILLNVNVPQTWNGSVRFTKQSSKITRNLLKT